MFERDKKTETGDGVTSLIDADMRITGTVVSSGDIVLAGQYTQVYAVVVLQGLTNAYGLVVARRAQVIGTPRHSAGKIGIKVRFNLGHLGVLGRLSRYCQKNHGT